MIPIPPIISSLSVFSHLAVYMLSDRQLLFENVSLEAFAIALLPTAFWGFIWEAIGTVGKANLYPLQEREPFLLVKVVQIIIGQVALFGICDHFVGS